MTPSVAEAFGHEWAVAAQARLDGDLEGAFRHLERAHILGQRLTRLHVRSHLGMLAIGWQRRDRREVVGQLARLLAAMVFSRLWVPDGNTGGTDISAFKLLPIPQDLDAILQAARG